MQENTNCYWKQQSLQQIIILPTHTIIHPHLDVNIIRYVQDIGKKLFGRSKAKKAIQRHPIIVTDAYYDYMMTLSVMKNEFESNLSVNIDEESH